MNLRQARCAAHGEGNSGDSRARKGACAVRSGPLLEAGELICAQRLRPVGTAGQREDGNEKKKTRVRREYAGITGHLLGHVCLRQHTKARQTLAHCGQQRASTVWVVGQGSERERVTYIGIEGGQTRTIRHGVHARGKVYNTVISVRFSDGTMEAGQGRGARKSLPSIVFASRC